jgi:hypothetical protein
MNPVLLSLLLACGSDSVLKDNVRGNAPSDAGSTDGADSGSTDGAVWKTVDVHRYRSCALRTDGKTVCWGQGPEGRTLYAPDTSFTSIAAGDVGGCGLEEEGLVECWGYSYLMETSSSWTFDTLDVGGYHACALSDTTPTCWGREFYGEIDNVTGPLSALSTGLAVTCGLDIEGWPRCWGWNDEGQQMAPAVLLRSIRASTSDTSCGVDLDGEAVCWGANRAGTGDAPAGPFEIVEAGQRVTCGLRTDGTIQCWGDPEIPLLQNAPSGTYTWLSVSAVHACAVSTAGELVCWGTDPGTGSLDRMPDY